MRRREEVKKGRKGKGRSKVLEREGSREGREIGDGEGGAEEGAQGKEREDGGTE